MIPFPDIDAVLEALEPFESATQYDELMACMNGLWSYLHREPTIPQWAALLSLTLDLGIDTIGTSALIRQFNIGNWPKMLAEFDRYMDSNPGRRESEKALIMKDILIEEAKKELPLTDDSVNSLIGVFQATT